jgi:hypothetical protein
MAKLIIAPNNETKTGTAGKLAELLSEFDPNASVKALGDGTFEVDDPTLVDDDAEEQRLPTNVVERDPAMPNFQYLTSDMWESEGEYAGSLPDNTSEMLYNIHRNNEYAAKLYATNEFHNMLMMLDYMTFAQAHLAGAVIDDTVQMCKIVDNGHKRKK